MNKLKTITSVISGLLLSASYAYGAGTSAGATITNQASVSYDAGAGTVVASSGSVSFKVQELVKATVAKLDASDISISSPQTDAAMKFKIKNDGNGSEGFRIVVTQDSGDEFDVTLGNIYIDDGDGILDTAVDTLYDNANPDALAADAEITIWVTSTIPGSLADNDKSNLNVSAVSATFINDGQSNPAAGAVVIGGGDSATDAVNAVAISSITSTFVVSDIDVTITKAITATRDNLGAGGSQAVPGAEVDYTLTVTVTGTGTANNIVVSDPLPTQLRLKDGNTGTINVGGNPETATSADTDGTSYDANTNTISVDLGNIDAGDPAIAIEFTTVIQQVVKMKKLLATLCFLPAFALAQVELKTDMYKVVETQNNNGTSKVEWVAPDNIVPGDKVGYRISFNNTGEQAADDIVLNNPIPENTIYVEDSARGANTNINFSVDGGQQFAKPEQLFVEVNGKKVPAIAKDYTHVRWTLTSALPAGKEGSVQYVVQVK